MPAQSYAKNPLLDHGLADGLLDPGTGKRVIGAHYLVRDQFGQLSCCRWQKQSRFTCPHNYADEGRCRSGCGGWSFCPHGPRWIECSECKHIPVAERPGPQPKRARPGTATTKSVSPEASVKRLAKIGVSYSREATIQVHAAPATKKRRRTPAYYESDEEEEPPPERSVRPRAAQANAPSVKAPSANAPSANAPLANAVLSYDPVVFPISQREEVHLGIRTCVAVVCTKLIFRARMADIEAVAFARGDAKLSQQRAAEACAARGDSEYEQQRARGVALNQVRLLALGLDKNSTRLTEPKAPSQPRKQAAPVARLAVTLRSRGGAAPIYSDAVNAQATEEEEEEEEQEAQEQEQEEEEEGEEEEVEEGEGEADSDDDFED